jgi:ABC-type Mn2+/Zn2+ transport system permease subunit
MVVMVVRVCGIAVMRAILHLPAGLARLLERMSTDERLA